MTHQNQIKERPILFSAPMIRAILSGNKTQTRRTKGLLNVNPKATEIIRCDDWPRQGDFVARFRYEGEPERYEVSDILKAPYGVGDILYVKEMPWWNSKIGEANPTPNKNYPWHQPQHMPKDAARIWLRVKAVRVERVQDISEADAKAEGMTCDCPVGYIPTYQKGPLRYHFIDTWCNIHSEESWEENPWVFVIDFEVLSTTGKPKDI